MGQDTEADIVERLHPRERPDLIGHEQIERQLLQAYRSRKLHHAWMLSGPRGIGKATLAYRFARFILRHPDVTALDPQLLSMNVAESDPVFRRIAAQGHSDLLTITRAYDPRAKRLKTEIGVDEARHASQFLSRTAGEGGWRIAIIDAADEMNGNAANAILKSLEEPPPRTLFLLVTHIAGRVLPTIRSRCVRLELGPLREPEVERVLGDVLPDAKTNAEARTLAINLADGSPGRAIRLLEGGGLKLFREFVAIVEKAPNLEYGRAFEFAEKLRGAQMLDDYRLFTEILDQWLSRQIRAAGKGESDWNGRIPLERVGVWAEKHESIMRSIHTANALNLDRREVVVQALRLIEETARGTSLQ
ncbi:DNA polymerase-3 subunit delta' [Rhodoligotrophos appendicifer]|uniref:DNA polymerase III subunit delta' n=1 Tax=Rhodoligotrophos appendicifer TaxID=987056 RepID=UPI001186DC30|nr:DNA polymerase III subunit delta' [Rhodoligotrophos appendicifer]